MKKLSLIFIIALSFAFFSCTNIKGNQETGSLSDNETVKSNDNQNIEEPEFLTYDSFLEKVWNFEKNPQEWIYEGDVPCVIDFYADWCKPCKMVAPIMEDLAKEYKGKVKIYKINVDKEKKLASVFQVRSIPSVLFSPKEGKPMMQTGALPRDQYVKIIEDNLLNK
jgi:thioredoxin 1